MSRSLTFRPVFFTLAFYLTLAPSSQASALDVLAEFAQSPTETVELFDCTTGASLGQGDVAAFVASSACLAPACAKHSLVDEYGIHWDYCDGACSAGKSCTATYRNPQNPGEGIKRCSCKPTPASASAAASGGAN